MVLSTSIGALAQLGARHTGSVEVTGSNPVCSIDESTWNRDFSVYTNYETCEWLRPFAFVVYGKMYRFALCEAVPLITWHGKLQHGWERFTTILPSRHS